LRTEIRLTEALPGVESRLAAEHAAALTAAAAERAKVEAEVEAEMKKLARRLAAVRERESRVRNSAPPRTGPDAVESLKRQLREVLKPPTAADARREREELLARSARASLAMQTAAMSDKPRFSPPSVAPAPRGGSRRIGEAAAPCSSCRIGDGGADLTD
jgi:hypothetical protein